MVYGTDGQSRLCLFLWLSVLASSSVEFCHCFPNRLSCIIVPQEPLRNALSWAPLWRNFKHFLFYVNICTQFYFAFYHRVQKGYNKKWQFVPYFPDSLKEAATFKCFGYFLCNSKTISSSLWPYPFKFMLISAIDRVQLSQTLLPLPPLPCLCFPCMILSQVRMMVISQNSVTFFVLFYEFYISPCTMNSLTSPSF